MKPTYVTVLNACQILPNGTYYAYPEINGCTVVLRQGNALMLYLDEEAAYILSMIGIPIKVTPTEVYDLLQLPTARVKKHD